MTTARDLMNDQPPYCELGTPLREIAARFADEHISGLIVVDDEKRLLGVITESDLIDQQGKLHMPTAIAVFDMVIPLGEGRFEQELARLQALVAEDLMATNIRTVDVNADLAEVASLMSEEQMHHLPVLDGDTVVGLISRHDVIKALAGRLS